MAKKIIVSILGIGVIVGFITGLILAFDHIAANRYIQYKLFRLASFNIQKALNQYVILLLGFSIILVIVFSIANRIWKRLYQKIIRVFEPGYKPIRTIALVLIITLVLLNLGIYIDSKINIPETPNVIIIGIDTLRADHVRFYGYQRNTTPNMDKIAKEAIVFTKTYATSSWTLPTFHSILTSLYQISHGVFSYHYKLDDSFVTVSELMKERGYKTAGFISGPYLKSVFGFNQGYDLYEESASSVTDIESQKDITSPELTESVLSWLSKNRMNKFFLFIHYWDPHYDYIPPMPYDKTFDPDYKGTIDGTAIEQSNKINPKMDRRDLEHIKALYDGEILWTDTHLERLFTFLKETGLDTDTIIVIVSDHGEEFLDHGSKGHQRTLYNEVIHVPFILKIPGIDKTGKIDAVVSIVDIMPTILDILDIENPAQVDGKSVMPLIRGEKDKIHEEVYSELLYSLIALIKKDWKLIYNDKTSKFRLYDIKNDPHEKHNLIDTKPEIRGKLKRRLLGWIKRKQRQMVDAPRAKQDDETIEQLKSLGYIQ